MKTTVRAPDGRHITVEHPEGASDEEIIAYAQKNYAPSPRSRGTAMAQEAEDRARYDPTAGMSTGEKILANVGAGMSNVIEGAKQFVGAKSALSDAELREKRARDAALARSTEVGTGASYLPSAGTVLQFTGEALPTMVIPGGAGVTAARAALPRALALLPKTATGAGVAAGAVGGVAGGTLAPVTEDESRLVNAAVGGTVGAALPGAVSAVRAAAARRSAANRASLELERQVGAETGAAIEHRAVERAAEPAPVRAIPETLAEATGSTRAAQLESELGRSEATAHQIAEFKRAQNVARYEAAHGATREAPQIEARATAREELTKPMREGALRAAGEAPDFAAPVAQAVDDLTRSAAIVNPAVKRVADYVRSTLGEDVTPARLYEVRKVLVDKLSGPHQIGDELSASVKGAEKQTLALRDAIDDALDAASGGQWKPYLKTYAAASRPVEAARAAQEARSVLEAPGLAQLGGVPETTATLLKRALGASVGGSRTFPLALSDPAGAELQGVLAQALRGAEVQKARKLGGTAGGGSQTSLDLDKPLQQIMLNTAFPIAAPVFHYASRFLGKQAKLELARLVMDPQAAGAAIAQARELRRPLTPAQQAFVQLAAMESSAAVRHGARNE